MTSTDLTRLLILTQSLNSRLHKNCTLLTGFIVGKFRSYQNEHMYKLIGVGLTKQTCEISPQLCSHSWLELHAVAFVFSPAPKHVVTREHLNGMTVDKDKG
jgi:hypothetical protein